MLRRFYNPSTKNRRGLCDDASCGEVSKLADAADVRVGDAAMVSLNFCTSWDIGGIAASNSGIILIK